MPVAAGLQSAGVDPEDRIVAIDIVRGAALFGVLMVNLETAFRVSIFSQFVPNHAPASTSDRLLSSFIDFALDMKAFSLFSILFGVGLAMQFDRLATQGRPFYWLGRRLLVLSVFGLVHIFLIWNGDILLEYSIAALLILPLLGEDTFSLGLYSTGVFALYVVTPLMHFHWPSVQEFAQTADAANRVYPVGSYPQVISRSFAELPLMLELHRSIFARTVSLMLFGAWVWRSGFLRDPQRYRASMLVLGILGVAAGVALTAAQSLGVVAHYRLLDLVTSRCAPPIQAVGYAALIFVGASHPSLGRLLRLLAPLGRMAFTNYICESLLFCFIFLGYGLGEFGRMTVTTAFVIGIAVYVAQIWGSAIWLRSFRFGPLEWLWRSLMYGRYLPIRASR